MPWRQTEPMTEKVRFVLAYQDDLYAMTELCERFQISRKTGWFFRKLATVETNYPVAFRLLPGDETSRNARETTYPSGRKTNCFRLRETNCLRRREGIDCPAASLFLGSDSLTFGTSRWLAGGKTQGWNLKTLDDRCQTTDQFLSWLENESEAPSALSSLQCFVF